MNQQLTRPFGVLGLPETFFLDHDWTFFGTIKGDQTAEEEGTVVRGAISEEELVTNVDFWCDGGIQMSPWAVGPPRISGTS